MTTRIDWHAELDASFGDGRDRPPTDFLGPGRTALRRRRTALGAAALASAIVVGGIGWAVAPGGDGARSGEVASEAPSPTPSESTSERPEAVQPSVSFLGNPATYDDAGTLRVAKGWTVVEQIDNPMGYTRRGWTSVGLRSTRGAEEKFTLAVMQGKGSTSIHTNDAVGALADWLVTAVATQRTLDVANAATGGGEVEPVAPAATMTSAGELLASEGARLVRQRRAGDLPPALAGQGDHVVAAEVRTADGATVWVLGRVVAGEAIVDSYTTAFADLDAFVDWASQQLASGEGLR
ncbi:hypothetical protein [Nocardioides currus]|uniref:Uncharacterized protein n=1 Tax=Nocardioides currus TaxID=2133958 RepID=A0A2R7YTQ6_9ACTN|nr:hypothetical protein [Nocardioides currus]PUA79777.1 hypothetical protein C7S10_16995 [Nocardioides currus]